MRTYKNSKVNKNPRAVILWATISILFVYTCVILISSLFNNPRKVDYSLDLGPKKIPFLIKQADKMYETKQTYRSRIKAEYKFKNGHDWIVYFHNTGHKSALKEMLE